MAEPQLWVSTLEVGCFFGLLGLAFLLTWLASGDFNFTTGPLAVLAPMCTSWLVVNSGYGLWVAVAASVAVVLALSAVVELGVVRPIKGRTTQELPVVIALAATLFALMQGTGLFLGRTSLPGQPLVHLEPLEIGSTIVPSYTQLLLLATVVAFALVIAWIKLSPSGRLLRSVGSNPEAAKIIGLPVARIRLTAFILSGLIAALAGLLYAPKGGIGFDRGLTWTLAGFMVIVFGGTGSIFAPLVAGLLLGMVEIFLPYYFSSSATSYAFLVLALLFFAFRPEGIFMKRVRA